MIRFLIAINTSARVASLQHSIFLFCVNKITGRLQRNCLAEEYENRVSSVRENRERLRTFNTGDYNEKESLVKYKFKRIQRTFFLQRKDNFFGFKMRFIAQLLQYEKTLEVYYRQFFSYC